MSLRCFLTVLASMGSVLGAQSAPDSVQCRIILSGASRDSQSTRLSIVVSPFDTANHLSAVYRGLVGAGIRQFLSVPKPLPLHVYDPRSALSGPGPIEMTFATLTLRSVYRAILLRDGHLTRMRAVGGTRDEAFDAAVIRAMEELSASELLPPPSGAGTAFTGDSLDLRILVTPYAMRLLSQPGNSSPDEGATPVLQLRLPIRRITQGVRPKAGNRAPLYPTDLRKAGIEGSTLFEFVVDASGRADLTTVQALSATAPQFIKAALDALPDLRFEPLYVEECPVPVLVRMPFDFSLIRH